MQNRPSEIAPEQKKLKKQARGRHQSIVQKRAKAACNRVPDETKNLEDTVCKLDTNYLLLFLGFFKLLLVVPLLISGVILISVRSAALEPYAAPTQPPHVEPKVEVTAVNKYEETANSGKNEPTQTSYEIRQIGNESLAPVWTAIMLATSAATDFITVRKRRGSTIVVYMLISTVSFVACILCIEYDRLEIIRINSSPYSEKLNLHFRLYLSCVIVASIGVATGSLTIFVGTRMAALEQHRLYMEREGLQPILTKKSTMLPISLMTLAMKLNCIQGTDSMLSVDYDASSTTIHNESAADKTPLSTAQSSSSSSPTAAKSDGLTAPNNHVSKV